MRAAPLAFLVSIVLPAIAASQNLIINNLRGQTIAYEIPESEGRAVAIHYIEQIRDRFLPRVEIVDATRMDDASLRAKLKGTLMLYTILSENSRLLRLAAQPLPFRIEGGTMHWADLSAPARDLRVVFVGRHPYGDGYSVVYAAGSNALLARANDVFHGACSFHIFEGAEGRLLREGFYDKTFSLKPDRLSLEDANADVREFFLTLEKNHPHLLAKVTKKDYEDLKQRTAREVKARMGPDGKIGIEDLAYSLSYAAAFFQDGHTTIRWGQPVLNQNTTRGKRFPPFWLDSENGRLFVVSSNDPALNGTEILEVNGRPAADFLKPALDRISAETRTYRTAIFVLNQAFWYYLTNVFSDETDSLKVRAIGGQTREQVVRTVDFADFQKLARPRKPSPGTQLDFFDDGRIARLVIPTLVYGADRKKSEEVFDKAFDQIKERQSSDLIIDIRGNSGGDSRMGDYVLRFVHAGLAGKPESFFAGNTYMLTDHYVFSSAVMFADAFRDYRAGTLIGYETGGTPSHYGYPRSFRLKNSGIELGVSRTHFNAPKPRPGDDRHGVLPDVPVTRELLVPYQGEADPVLSFTLAYIRKK